MIYWKYERKKMHEEMLKFAKELEAKKEQEKKQQEKKEEKKW